MKYYKIHKKNEEFLDKMYINTFENNIYITIFPKADEYCYIMTDLEDIKYCCGEEILYSDFYKIVLNNLINEDLTETTQDDYFTKTPSKMELEITQLLQSVKDGVDSINKQWQKHVEQTNEIFETQTYFLNKDLGVTFYDENVYNPA